MRRVEDIVLKDRMSVDSLVREMEKGGGFVAKKLAEAVDILEEMVRDKDCTTFLSFPACVVATGMRGVLKELVKRKWIDVIITTCGALDHDLARVWGDYFHGSFYMDDVELHKKGIHRLGNVLISVENYGKAIEERLQPLFHEMYKERKMYSTKELVWKLGEMLKDEERREESILYWAWKNEIPIFVPGITDGAVGSQLWLFYQEHRDFVIDSLKDEQDLSDIVFEAKKSGAIVIGGGISKHHVIWWNQFRGGLDYAIYLTTAVEYDGSLSGARTREAITWSKIKEKARHITVEGDATVNFPIMVAALAERLSSLED